MSDRLNDRFVVPIALPLFVLVLAAISAISLSRIFLAVSADAAPIIGIVVAFAILGSFYLISTRDQLSRGMLAGLVATAAVLVLGAGIAGAVKGEREFHDAAAEGHGEGTGEGPIAVSASDLAFDKEEIDLPAETAVTIAFHNEDDESVQHNISIYEEAGGAEIFRGEIVAGGEEADYELTTPAAGTYYFQCDVHPDQMNGAVVVSEDATTSRDADGVNATTSSTMEH
jgi:plastocyanin